MAEPTAHPGAMARGVVLNTCGALAKLSLRVRKARSGAVHEARVCLRRLEAALLAVGPALDGDVGDRLSGQLRKARRGLGDSRDDEVLTAMLEARLKVWPRPARAAGATALKRQKKRAARSAHRAAKSAGAWGRAFARKSVRRAVKKAAWVGPAALGVLAREALERVVAGARDAAGADLSVVENVHALRITLKRVRYTVELFEGVWRGEKSVAALRRLQRTLGQVNDEHGLLVRLEELSARRGRGESGGPDTSWAALLRAQRKRLDEAMSQFREAWKRLGGAKVLGKVTALAAPAAEQARGGRAGPRAVVRGAAERSAPSVITGGAGAAASEGARSPESRRLAAIDIGTNSTRLIIAEAFADGTYRVLDDEKELTRLGAGLDATGRIDERALEQTAYTVAKMKRIAEGYGVTAVRGVATCAVREAANGQRLVDLIRQWCGLPIEIISGDEEGLLAYRSVAHAFDLGMFSSAVLDVGGGSTEIVLASGGVVESVVSLPIGAVRLSERYGGAEASGGENFKAMRRHVRGMLKERLGGEPFAPQLIVGTGGTCTSLAAMAMHRERERSPHAPPPSAVQGFEMKLAVVENVLEELRELSLEERARVPGLSPDRADIIVAGVTIVHEVMRHLRAARLRAHDGGIRDGLLLSMVQEMYPGERPAAPRNDPVAAARRFAAACRTDEKHGEQVAALALRMFDQLAALEQEAGGGAAWARPQQRVVLQCACLLLDVGYVINYSKHHVHSFNLIRHSELSGLSAEQVELVAQVARYHRAAEPKEGHEHFAALDEAGKEVVRRLAAIVRLAVGLDRTHTQAVKDVRVSKGARRTRFVVVAAENPSVDIWGAERKAEMFKNVFGVEPEFVWAGGGVKIGTVGGGAAPAVGVAEGEGIVLNGVHPPRRTAGRAGRRSKVARGVPLR